jgi:PAS domain-containing protein
MNMSVSDPVRRWMRELGQLRSRIARQRQLAANDVVQEALAMCDSLLRELAGAHSTCDTVRAELQARAAASAAFFELLPVPSVVTDHTSSIVSANSAAALLLNTNIRHLKSRELLVYAEDREGFRSLLKRLESEGDGAVHSTLRFRPRERKPRPANVVTAPLPGAPPGLWLWFLQPTADRASADLFERTNSGLTGLDSPHL